MRGMGAKKAVVVGLTFLDNIFFDIDRFPELGTESFAKGHAVTVGGIAITAVNLARLGVPTTLVTSLGDDVFGRFLRERLAGAGLELVAVPTLNGRTNQSVAIVAAGDRGFLTVLAEQFDEVGLLQTWLEARGWGGEGSLAEINSAGAVRSQGAGGAGSSDPGSLSLSDYHLHLGLNNGSAWQAAQRARRLGMSVSVSISHPSIELIRQGVVPEGALWNGVDLVFLNEQEAEAITGRTGSEMLAVFGKASAVTAVTRGELGAWLVAGEDLWFSCEALKVEAVDTTGAGDAFASGFLAGYLSGRSWEECLALGVVCGSRSTTALGGMDGVPQSFEEAAQLAATVEVAVRRY